MNNEHHVTYNDEKKNWGIQKDGSGRPSHTFKTKQEAIDKAREISINQKTELVIHNKNGQISGKDSHGNDPITIPG